MTTLSHSPSIPLWNRWRFRGYVLAFLMVLPALINFLVFRYLPILSAGWSSLWNYSLIGGYGDFVGLRHYLNLVKDPIFLNSLKVTATFVALKLPIQIILSLALAILLQGERRGDGIIRTLVFIPVVAPIAVVSILWAMMYHSQVGLINSALATAGIPRQPFLTSPSLALPAITLMMIWKDLGFSMIIILAGIKGIPQEFYEAARVDGATGWQVFRFITIPLLRRVLMFVLVTQTISSFQVFVPVEVMTGGGPLESTKVVIYNMYQTGFLLGDMGYASAMAILILAILLVVSLIQMRALRTEWSL